MVVSNGGAARGRDAGERFIEIGRDKRFDQRTRVDRLAVLGANPVGDQGNVSKGKHLRDGEQATHRRTRPSPRIHGSCGEGEREPKHGLVLTPRKNEVKAWRPDQRPDDLARVRCWQLPCAFRAWRMPAQVRSTLDETPALHVVRNIVGRDGQHAASVVRSAPPVARSGKEKPRSGMTNPASLFPTTPASGVAALPAVLVRAIHIA